MSDIAKESAQAAGADEKPYAFKNSDSTTTHSDFAHASQSWDASETSSNNASAEDSEASAKRVREVLGDAQEVLQRNYRAASDSADDFVHENPWKAITLAAVGGIIVGMLISR
ncbi:DUF883 family protein [Caballeronia sordidicola]|uniref:DUF883 domain-containing protein n=1 Tax=Caballeronia sordidicola TaxID=196367 RepID=A0A242N6Y7_CABSO|nr:DUF883 family protein [Caballeronia sordidicola]OTP79352.1 hypothetical protein PAMC26510_05860 [Caballeronia sordidicola]